MSSSSELGKIAKDVGNTVDKWSSKLNGALQQWNKDAQALATVLEDALSSLKSSNPGNKETRFSQDKQIYLNLQTKYENMKPDTSSNKTIYTLNASEIANLDQLVTDLGLSTSVIHYKPIGSNAGTMNQTQVTELYNVVTSAIHNLSINIGTVRPGLVKLQETVAELKQDETRDLFKVMACFSAMRENENTETSAMKSLKDMVSQIMQSIN